MARLSGHRTAAVFKRYDVVEEQDLEAAVKVLNRARASTPPEPTAPGYARHEREPGANRTSVDPT